MFLLLLPSWLSRVHNFFALFLCKYRTHQDVLPSVRYRVFRSDVSPMAEDPRTDIQLIHDAGGDPQAFSILFDRYFTRVYRFHSFRIRQREDAEDLTSETFVKIFEKLHTYKDKGVPFSVWVFTIARHTLIDFTRRCHKNVTSLDALEEFEEPGQEFDHDAIDRSVLMEKLWKASAVLPEKQQQIWALKLSSGMTHAEIGSTLGMTENNVNVALSRSMKTLRTYLSHAHHDPDHAA